MFGQQTKMRLQSLKKRNNPEIAKYCGINRRAVALFPGADVANEDDHFELTRKLSVREQLIHIEADHLTCCVKITSPKHKSRSAILIVGGRVLACVYGSKSVPQQVFGKKAYEKILADITHQGNQFQGFMLDDRLVLAAGAMFHGQLFNATKHYAPLEALDFLNNEFARCETPGCIAIVDKQDSPICVLYFSNRSLIGISSFLEDQPLDDEASIKRYLAENPRTQILASMLNLSDYSLLKDLTFSLSGLIDFKVTKQPEQADKEMQEEAAKLVLLKTVKPRTNVESVQRDRFVAMGRNMAPKLNRSVQSANPYRIDPSRTF